MTNIKSLVVVEKELPNSQWRVMREFTIVDGKIRVSKDDCDITVKVNGELQEKRMATVSLYETNRDGKLVRSREPICQRDKGSTEELGSSFWERHDKETNSIEQTKLEL